jgi:regulator of replication initiation timing
MNTEELYHRYKELKDQNHRLLKENVDLKIENEGLKARVQSLECVAKLIQGSGVK